MVAAAVAAIVVSWVVGPNVVVVAFDAIACLCCQHSEASLGSATCL